MAAVPFPEVSHLQFLALRVLELTLANGKRPPMMSAHALYSIMREMGAGHRSRQSFYQFMGRLEEAGYVSAKRRRMETGHLETRYRLLKKGQKTMKRSKTFYGVTHDANT
jgi:DNA-binding PadR family transcriptional regulator